MRTSAAGSELPIRLSLRRPPACGFTLVELLVVVAIIAIGSAGVVFALRDASGMQLEREAHRLAALLEAGRAHSRATGQVLRWQAVEGGFRFEGPADSGLPGGWLSDQVQVRSAPVLVLGPEPVIGAQAVELIAPGAPERSLLVATDGLRPFAVSSAGPP